MKSYLLAVVFSLFCISISSKLWAQEFPEAITPQQTINLLADPEFKDFTAFINPKRSTSTDPKEIWMIQEDGTMLLDGKAMGYLRTNKAYRDYHLVFEYKWGERTYGARADKARDNGLMLHAYGGDGAVWDTWINSIEVNVFEGGVGEILPIGAVDKNGKKAPTRITAEVERKKGRVVWTPGGKKEVFPKEDKDAARIDWSKQDPNWKDEKGFRGINDIDNPLGEWNRVEVICRGDTMQVFVNGQLVNEATDCYPSAGYVALQTEDAQIWVRRYELHPLDSFKEKWVDQGEAKNMGYSGGDGNVLPRRLPLSPEESAKLWHVGGDYEMQLVASEPLTRDPVDLTWDEQGRMFVAEMGDYPLPIGDDGPFLSRIRLLTDTDGDGIMDKAVTWAEDLDHVQGMTPINGGLLVTTHTRIIFLKDSNGDDKADVREVLFTVNAPIHGQLQISSPRYGLDNHLWLSNGLQAKTISPETDPDKKLDITGLNLRFDPRHRTIEGVTGVGQFGGSLDDWNRHFFCSNRNPLIFAAMPLEAARRTPLAGIATGSEDLLAVAHSVHPILLTHTTSPGHAGTYTAACGLAVYRGNLMPQLAGEVFVCEPTAQLISRNKLTPKGSSFTAKAIVDQYDFISSEDEWSRPVQVRNGPDGALYICDMYRRFIDHPMYFPDEFAEANYMRAGVDQGRIYRLIPKGKTVQAAAPLPAEDALKLVPFLSSENGWTRTTAQRLLVEKQDLAVVPALEKLLADASQPKAQVHALWTLQGLGALAAEPLKSVIKQANESGLLENVLQAAREAGLVEELKLDFHQALTRDLPRFRFLYFSLISDASLLPEADTIVKFILEHPSDSWLRKAIFSSVPKQATVIFHKLLSEEAFEALPAARTSAIIQDFSRIITAVGDLEPLAKLTTGLKDMSQSQQLAVVLGMNQGIVRSSLKQDSLTKLIEAKIPKLREGISQIETILSKASIVALDKSVASSDRLAALQLVAQLPFDDKVEVAKNLINLSETPDIQVAACRLFSRDKPEQISSFFFDRWSSLPPASLGAAISILTANKTTRLMLMKKMAAGEINPGLMPPTERWLALRQGNEETKELAKALFGDTNNDRAAVVRKYADEVAKLKGDPKKGAKVYESAACITCHRIGDTGVDVGPPLNDVKIKPIDALITDILDPNRVVEDRWVVQTLQTTRGQTFAGIIHSEDATAVSLRMAGGVTTTVARSEIKSLNSLGESLMPVGLEGVISPQDMADLIAYLKK